MKDGKVGNTSVKERQGRSAVVDAIVYRLVVNKNDEHDGTDNIEEVPRS